MSMNINQSFFTVVKQEYVQKQRLHARLIASLVVFQGVALLLSTFGQKTEVYRAYISVREQAYSGELFFLFSILWSLMLSFYVISQFSEGKQSQGSTYRLVTHIANFLLMLMLSLFASLSSVLLSLIFRLAVLSFYGTDQLFRYEALTLKLLLITVVVIFLYHMLTFSFGYVIGAWMKRVSLFSLLLLLCLLIPLFFPFIVERGASVVTFFTKETKLSLFALKVMGTVVLCWLLAIGADRRWEVD